MDRNTAKWITIVAIILVIIIAIVVVIYTSKRPHKSSLYTDSDMMLMAPQRHWHHLDFDPEIRTVYGKISDEQYFLVRAIRRGNKLWVEEYDIDSFNGTIKQANGITETAKFHPNSADLIEKPLQIGYKFASDTFLDSWDISTPLRSISLRANRFPCIIGNKGFLSFDQDYTMAGYVLMDTTSQFKQVRLSHDWGQIEPGRYTHQRYHIFLDDGSAAEIYVVIRNDGIQYTNMCLEQEYGEKTNFPVEISNGTIFTSAKISQFRIELFPDFSDSATKMAIWQVKLYHGENSVSGWCLYESYAI